MAVETEDTATRVRPLRLRSGSASVDFGVDQRVLAGFGLRSFPYVHDSEEPRSGRAIFPLTEEDSLRELLLTSTGPIALELADEPAGLMGKAYTVEPLAP